MKITAVFISFLFIVIVSCKSSKKIQSTMQTVSKIDTAVIVSQTNNSTIDSANLIKDVYNKVIKNKINFTTFSAKLKMSYNSDTEDQDAIVYVRLKKDSVIWLSLRGPLGIEGYRILITNDSVKIMNLLKKYAQNMHISYLQQLSHLPLDCTVLQDVIVGNAVFIDSNIVSYKTDSSNNALQVLMLGRVFRNLVSIDKTAYKIISSKIDDIDTAANRSFEQLFSEYDNDSGVPFSGRRKITVSEESKMYIDLDFKQHTFNQSVTFPFNVPDSYKKL